jgi:hydroxymethylpyrimidine/phosphomethylpyrimidine kinase
MKEQGNALLAMGCGAVLMKGGHLDDAESPDWLFTRDGEVRFTAPRVQTKIPTARAVRSLPRWRRCVHGMTTGPIRYAKQTWLSAALAKADTLEVGHGIGPVHHFHAWW